MSKKNDFSFELNFLDNLIVGIGEVSMMTNIPTRQIRYWEEKGLIESLTEEEGKNRRYNYKNVKKMLLIKEMMDEGFTLDSAAQKARKKSEKGEQVEKEKKK